MALILLFTAIGFLLYAPILHNGFLSDDYDSLFRIYIQKRIVYREFLRPMIDFSFYFNYFISGLSPLSYYIFNVGVHVINCLLLFRFASGYLMFPKIDQWLFAFITGFLFLIYPFHNESIVWLSGRLSSMATLFALLSLITAQEKTGTSARILSGIFYLLGLLCYESVILLPIIILLLNWLRSADLKKTFRAGLFWAGVAFVYLVVRYTLSGEITGGYGDRLTDTHYAQKILNSGKVFGRLFLPGSENQKLLILLTALIFLITLSTFRRILKSANVEILRKKYIALLFMFSISLLLAIAFGVSTRTSEGDRLLYFPSCFFCMLVAGAVLWIFPKSSYRIAIISTVATYFIWFLEINNRQWVKASGAARAILSCVKNNVHQKIILVNVPDELEGAFVFRNGLKKALLVNHIDTADVKIMNYLKRSDYLTTEKIISVQKRDSTLLIYPYLCILEHTNGTADLTNSQNNTQLTIPNQRNLIYYWNKEELVPLFETVPNRK